MVCPGERMSFKTFLYTLFRLFLGVARGFPPATARDGTARRKGGSWGGDGGDVCFETWGSR